MEDYHVQISPKTNAWSICHRLIGIPVAILGRRNWTPHFGRSLGWMSGVENATTRNIDPLAQYTFVTDGHSPFSWQKVILVSIGFLYWLLRFQLIANKSDWMQVGDFGRIVSQHCTSFLCRRCHSVSGLFRSLCLSVCLSAVLCIVAKRCKLAYSLNVIVSAIGSRVF